MKVAFVFSDKALTNLMRIVDLFESFKVVVKNSHAIITVDEWGQDQTEAIRKACEPENYGLVACYGIDTVYYIDPTVKVVSTGQNWATIEDYVKFYQNDLALKNDINSDWHVGLTHE